MTTSHKPDRGKRRDQESWAKPVESLKVDHAPTGAVNLNVEGRQVVGPLQGFGQLWQKTYWVRLSGLETTPTGVISDWKENFSSFWPEGGRFYAPVSGIAPGEVALALINLKHLHDPPGPHALGLDHLQRLRAGRRHGRPGAGPGESERPLVGDRHAHVRVQKRGRLLARNSWEPGVDGQRKCPAKWPAKMSLVLLAMITDGSYSTRSRFMGGLRASMYFFAVSRWMPSPGRPLESTTPCASPPEQRSTLPSGVEWASCAAWQVPCGL